MYRLRVHGKMQSSNTGFQTLADTAIESPELIVDTSSPSGFSYEFKKELVITLGFC